MKKILLIDDDLSICEILQPHVVDLGYSLEYASNGTAGLEKLDKNIPDLILLDITMPGMNGFDVCKEIRTRHPYLPILILSSRITEIDKILGLELGADDYVVKPFSVSELLARIRSQLRRPPPSGAGNQKRGPAGIVCDRLSIDPIKRVVLLGTEPVEVTAKEFDVLLFLAQHPGTPFSREQLLDKIWGVSAAGYADNVTSLIRRLRTKIERDPSEPEYIQTMHGVGYRFKVDGESEAPDEE